MNNNKDQPSADAVVEANRALLLSRSQLGIKKYGATLSEANHAAPVLLQHAIEEALDLANYLQALVMAERATAAPAENIHTTQFGNMLLKYHYNHTEKGPVDELVAHINAWGAARYEAGRQEHFKLVLEWQKLYGGINDELQAMKERAERAEAALEEWRFTNKVDELGREMDQLRVALASRPAVDLSGLSKFNAVDFGPVPDGSYYLVSDVQALLSSDAQAPTGCSKDPACCPNNEGYGCDCSATTASTDGLPPLPPHPESQVMQWSELEKSAIQTYARQARADALEEAARVCGAAHKSTHPADLADDIRALIKKG